MLSVSEPGKALPISVEWTVPFRETYFHIGVHNLPAFEAPDWMDRLKAFTANPVEDKLAEIFDALYSNPSTLLVFNHPMWDEKLIGAALHRSLVAAFWKRYGQFLHALELNGRAPGLRTIPSWLFPGLAACPSSPAVIVTRASRTPA